MPWLGPKESKNGFPFSDPVGMPVLIAWVHGRFHFHFIRRLEFPSIGFWLLMRYSPSSLICVSLLKMSERQVIQAF